MIQNLLNERWTDLDTSELRLLLNEQIGGPGQYEDRSKNSDTIYLPLAGTSCQIAVRFRDRLIIAIHPGPAFDVLKWKRISEEIENSLLAGPIKVGRDYSFSSFRVSGFWRGERSGVQILPPLEDAPCAPVEMAEHPFILEFPMRATGSWEITNHRRMREHRKLTLLLNILLAGRTSLQLRRANHLWAIVPREDGQYETRWVQPSFFAKFGAPVSDALSLPVGEQIEQIAPEAYQISVVHDGRHLQVPVDLDESIYLYQRLLPRNKTKFDRASFWFDVASRLWTISVSSSFASLISTIEALTDRGTMHRVFCQQCKNNSQHEVPGATERFRAFFETYAPDNSLRNRRSKMYSLRSGILHGSDLMQLDQDLAFGWDPPWLNEEELQNELWSLTRVALRNWLKTPSTA